MTIKVSTLLLVIAALVLLVAVSIFIDSHPGEPSSNNGPTLDQQASSTLSQALQTARWVQKEYPPLNH